MPEQRQIQNASVVRTRQQSHQMGLERRFMGKVHWMWAWKNSRILISKGGGTCHLFKSPEAQLYLFTLQLSLPCFAPYIFTKAGPRSFIKPLHDRSSRGPCLQLVLFERNLAKFYHRRIPPAKLTAGKSCVWAVLFPWKVSSDGPR